MKPQKEYKSDFDKLIKLTEQMSPNKADERFWKLGKDKAGNGMAIIRFLPEISADKRPFVTYWEHYYKGNNNQWLVEKCPKTIGHDCPVCEDNQPNWELDDKTLARNRKAKHYFLANVLIISDLINKENNGKVFILKFGEKIFNKLKKKITPDFEIEDKMNPFNIKSGADFILKGTTIIANGSETFSYDESAFKEVSDLTTRFSNEELEEIMNSRHDIESEISFKTYEQLEKEVARVNKNGKSKSVQQNTDKQIVATAVANSVSSDEIDSLESYENADELNNDLESEEDFEALLKL